MSLLHGKRFIQHDVNGTGFTSGPVSLDIDDVNDLVTIIRAIPHTELQVGGSSQSLEDDDRWEPVVENLAAIHPSSVRKLQITAYLNEAGLDVMRITVRITPDRVKVEGWTTQDSTDLVRAVAKIGQRVAAAPGNGLSADRAAALLTWLLWVPFLVLLATWAYLDWRAWPGIVVVAIILGIVQRWWVRRDRLVWFLQRRRRGWFQQKSRKELTTERANRRANLRVALWVGIPTALAGALATVLAALIG